MLDYESKVTSKGYNFVIGIDEAGRGPLAGPVVAAAVRLRDYQFTHTICDSKKLGPQRRELAFQEIMDKADVGVGIVSESVIDQKNILQATFYAMSIAVERLIQKRWHGLQDHQKKRDKICLLIDGHLFQSDLSYDYETVIGGDELSLSIASASIIAKVTRDRILKCYDQVFPQYGFGQHKGYATEAHVQAIRQHGFSIIHRKSFHVSLI
jgi:ribonuclease HII